MQPNIPKILQEATSESALQKQSKKALKLLAIDLGIPDKLKKEDIVARIPQELLKNLQFDLISKPIEQILSEKAVLKKHKIICDILRKFGEKLSQFRVYIPQPPPPLMFQMRQPQSPMPIAPQMMMNNSVGYCPCKVQPFRRQNCHEVKCVSCDQRVHPSCLGLTDERNLECPSCLIGKMDPLNECVKRLSKATMTDQQIRQTMINFILTVEEYNHLVVNDKYMIEIRSIRLDAKYLYETTWVDHGELIINKTKVMEFKPLNSNSSLKKRKDEKFTTRDYQIFVSGQNTILLKEGFIEIESKSQFKLAEKRLTPVQLIDKLKATKEVYKLVDESMQQIQRHCQLENEIAIDKIKVSLKCQFDMMMIEVVPRKWKCPICKIRIYELTIDAYQQQLISKYREQKKSIKEGVVISELADPWNDFDQSDGEQSNAHPNDEERQALKQVAVDSRSPQQIEESIHDGHDCIPHDELSIDRKRLLFLNDTKLRMRSQLTRPWRKVGRFHEDCGFLKVPDTISEKQKRLLCSPLKKQFGVYLKSNLSSVNNPWLLSGFQECFSPQFARIKVSKACQNTQMNHDQICID